MRIDNSGRVRGSLLDRIDAARDALTSLFKRDAALEKLRASETPEQRRLNDEKQRYLEGWWKMHHKGRPARDPQFRRQERLILTKGLDPEKEANRLIPLWRRYRAKYAAEHPPPQETEAERRKMAAMYRKAAGLNLPIPAAYRDAEAPAPRSFLKEGSDRLARLVQQTLTGGRDRGRTARSGEKGRGQGLGL